MILLNTQHEVDPPMARNVSSYHMTLTLLFCVAFMSCHINGTMSCQVAAPSGMCEELYKLLCLLLSLNPPTGAVADMKKSNQLVIVSVIYL